MLGWSVVVTMTASKVGTSKKKITFYVHLSLRDDNMTGDEGWEQSDFVPGEEKGKTNYFILWTEISMLQQDGRIISETPISPHFSRLGGGNI